MELNDEQYKALVVKYVKSLNTNDFERRYPDFVPPEGLTDEECGYLSSDCRAWLNELNSLLRDVEIQLSSHKTYMARERLKRLSMNDHKGYDEYRIDKNAKRTKTKRFLMSIEYAIREVKRVRAQQTGNA